MRFLGMGLGALLVLVVLWEAFETIVLPRTVIRKLRLTRLYYINAWNIYRRGAPRVGSGAIRESYLSAFGPASLLGIFLLWALALILGFALIQWGMGSHVSIADASQPLNSGRPGFGIDLYMSGTTFFTLGYGDVTPTTPGGRLLSVCEAGVGFAFLGIVIGYVPVIYSSFSRREVGISLLDARAGSPPTAGDMILRHARADNMQGLIPLLETFESWASDLMESHLSYPVLAYYRSQHDRESWISALASILDACALASLPLEKPGNWDVALKWQARMTFAMARHAVVDLALVFDAAPIPLPEDRLPTEQFEILRERLAKGGITLASVPDPQLHLKQLRAQYEPYIYALGNRMAMALPPWYGDEDARDNWQSSAWNGDSHL